MTQVDVSLTDYGLALECSWFAYLAGRRRETDSALRPAFVAFFLSVAFASLAGGTVHGFFLDEGSAGYRFLWPSALIALGMTALSGVYIGSELPCFRSIALIAKRVGLILFVAYGAVILFVRRDFLIAILDYVPSLIFMGLAFLLSYRRLRMPAHLIAFLGVCTMLLSAALQQAKLGINARYFGYNALYHILQALALWMLLFAAQERSASEEIVK